MPSLSRHNRYPGINAHLQTLLPKPPSAWPSFHTDFISLLTFELNAALPDPYQAASENSLQIFSLDTFGEQDRSKPIPDVGIFYRKDSPPGPSPAAFIATAPSLVLEFPPDLLEEEQVFRAVVIHENDIFGRPVARIELLSPSNKRRGQHDEAYLMNRAQALRSGTHLIEIDYFHTSPHPGGHVLGLPSYPHPQAYPYNIMVSSPGPNISTQLYGVGVLDPLPQALAIPLLNDDRIPLDLQKVYNQAFVGGKWANQVDYAAPLPPDILASFRADDQTALEAWRAALSED
jgi:hypothetical protein